MHLRMRVGLVEHKLSLGLEGGAPSCTSKVDRVFKLL